MKRTFYPITTDEMTGRPLRDNHFTLGYPTFHKLCKLPGSDLPSRVPGESRTQVTESEPRPESEGLPLDGPLRVPSPKFRFRRGHLHPGLA